MKRLNWIHEVEWLGSTKTGHIIEKFIALVNKRAKRKEGYIQMERNRLVYFVGKINLITGLDRP
jgi:hypothetical protein